MLTSWLQIIWSPSLVRNPDTCSAHHTLLALRLKWHIVFTSVLPTLAISSGSLNSDVKKYPTLNWSSLCINVLWICQLLDLSLPLYEIASACPLGFLSNSSSFLAFFNIILMYFQTYILTCLLHFIILWIFNGCSKNYIIHT